ncbi:hypothetical protein [Mycobacterium sp. Aquia_213]|uniref:hypothetical protein n=1 Tax=Mycobacterium sp. Aquia_213 TaxID=2991728 RepID=UPI002272029D|nr:hypothetical protein [Mycobacterium sp. Aquia_213]WAC93203.1 hypothetical protein LMQ14_08765 [Mycobacterium sp. Aquia_213]
MRRKIFMLAGTVAISVLIAGCSSGKSGSGSSQTPSSSSSATQTSSASPQAPSASTQAAPPDASTCLDISFAKDSLMVSMKPEDARKNADILEKYNPPDVVKAAIEHFVTTGGITPADPDADANNRLIATWLKQMCPNVNTY